MRDRPDGELRDDVETKKRKPRLRRYVWLIVVFWTAAVGGTLAWNLHFEHRNYGRQGSRVGGMREDGVGSASTGPLWAVSQQHVKILLLSHGGLWLLGLAGIGVGAKRIARAFAYRRQVQETLRRERDYSEAILGAAGALVVVTTTQGIVTRFNPACEALSGHTLDEVLGRPIWETVIPTESRETVRALFENFDEGSMPGTFENDWMAKDGRRHRTAWSNTFLRDANGRVEFIIGTGFDITERKQIEETLYFLSQHGWAESGEDFLAGLARFLAETLEVEYAMVAQLAGSAEEPLARTIALFASGKQANNIEYDLRGTPCEDIAGKEFCFHIDGVQQQFPDDDLLVAMGAESYAGILLWNSHGEPIGLIAVLDRQPMAEEHRVRTLLQVVAARAAAELDRRAAQTALRKSETLHRVLLSSISDAVFVTDDAGALTFVCPNTHVIFGHSAGEVHEMGRISRLLGDSLFDAAKLRWEGEITNIERQITDKFGKPHVLLINVKRVAIEEGTVLYTCRDITEQKQANDKLRRMETQLAHARRLSIMGEMVASIAHEVNQPLVSILNYAKAGRNVLADGNPSSLESLRKWNDEIAASATHAGAIVKRLRNSIRGKEPERSSADINQIIKESVQLVALEADRHQVDVKLDLLQTAPSVNVDSVQVQQVLMNLLYNAFEAMEATDPAKRKVTVRTTRADGFVDISVTDAGPGFSRTQARFFDAFVTTKAEGLGMGLAIGTTIVEAHGGKLWAEPDSQTGATLHFTLPIHRGDRARANQADRVRR